MLCFYWCCYIQSMLKKIKIVLKMTKRQKNISRKEIQKSSIKK